MKFQLVWTFNVYISKELRNLTMTVFGETYEEAIHELRATVERANLPEIKSHTLTSVSQCL